MSYPTADSTPHQNVACALSGNEQRAAQELKTQSVRAVVSITDAACSASGDTHSHTWHPIHGECGRYRCANTGALGYRANTGEIRTYRVPPQLDVEVTAQPAGYVGGWASAMPGSDEQERER